MGGDRGAVRSLAWLLLGFWLAAGTAAADCPGSALAVQVLGSGGPIADDDRASSGYLLWIDGRSRLLVDAGGGIFLRFGEARGSIEDLDWIAITHLHTDHVADLPALMKSGFFSRRERPLPVSGPSGAGTFPGMDEFMRGLFDPQRGVFRYLSGFLDGTRGLFETPVREVDAAAGKVTKLLEGDAFTLSAIGVSHGPVPALAYRVDTGGRRIVFSGDLRGDAPGLADFMKGADLLIMDHAIPGDADPVARNLHATPERIGILARDAGAKTLLLSHLMARSLADPARNLAEIRESYAGRVEVARDLMCLPVDGHGGAGS